MSDETSDTRAMRVLGLSSLALYAALAVFFWTAWNFKTSKIDEPVLWVTGAALVILYFWGLKFVRRSATSTIVVFAIATGLIGFVTPPFDSTDVYFYMASGWHQTHYGGNPYSGVLRNVEGAASDPMIQHERMERNRNPWLDIPMPYGFLFALVARTIAWLGRGNFWVTLWLFEFLNLVMHAGTALLLWKAGSLLPEGNGKVLLYLYCWNPFIVLQYLADLHNDIIVAFLVVLAAYLVLKDRPSWSLPLLVAAGLIKYVTLALVPFAFVFIVRHKSWKEGVRAALLSLTLVLATAAPYVSEIASFKYRLILAQISESTGSLHAFVVYTFRAFGALWPAFGSIFQGALWLAFAAFIGRELYVSWRDRSEEPLMMIQRWTSILFALIFVASSQFYAWYIGMMFPLALLTHRKTILTDAMIALSGAHMLSFTFLRRKAIGYFLIATVLPVLAVAISRTRRARDHAIPLRS